MKIISQRDFVTNICRRYKLLFRLPSKFKVSILTLFLSLPIIIIPKLIYHSNNTAILSSTIAFTLLLFVTIFIDRLLLMKSALATFKRLLSLALISNSICLIVIIIGLITTLFSSNLQGFYNLLIMGFFLSASFRLLIIKSIFVEKLPYALIIAIIQPMLLSILVIDWNRFIHSNQNYILCVALIPIISMAMYITSLDRLSWKSTHIEPLKLLKAFLLAWAEGDKRKLEEVLEKVSINTKLKTIVLSFEANNKPILVISDVHSGPLYPIGSYNITYEIYKWFYNQGYSPIIFHGVSNHEFDLPSEMEVKRFLQSLNNLITTNSSQTCTQPHSIKVRKATATGIAFGKIIMIMLTLSPYGMEDIPKVVKDKIETFANRAGFTHTVVIDTHNSQGEVLSEEDCKDLIEASEILINKLKNSPQYSFKVGVTHSSELNFTLSKDVGPVGFGVFVIEVNGKGYSIVAVDANNAIIGFREALMSELINTAAPLLELCTSDTHFSVGRVKNAKGYLALGNLSDVKFVAKMIYAMIEKAIARLTYASVVLKVCESNVKVIGKDFLYLLSIGLDKIIAITKKGGLIVTLISILAIIIAIFL